MFSRLHGGAHTHARRMRRRWSAACVSQAFCASSWDVNFWRGWPPGRRYAWWWESQRGGNIDQILMRQGVLNAVRFSPDNANVKDNIKHQQRFFFCRSLQIVWRKRCSYLSQISPLRRRTQTRTETILVGWTPTTPATILLMMHVCVSSVQIFDICV